MPNSILYYKCSQEEKEDILKVKVYAFFFRRQLLNLTFLIGRLKPSRATVDPASDCGIATFETGLSGNPCMT